jgi:tRNA(Ile)-lysidine synthase
MEARFRGGTLICRLEGHSSSRSLKRQLQDLGIPPWLRPQLPLITVDGELAAIADLAICAGHAATDDEEGLVLRWEYPVED